MSIKEIILSRGYLADLFGGFHFYPDVPEKLEKNALSKHQLSEYTTVLLLIDTTLVGSATNSWLMNEDGIFFTSSDLFKRYRSKYSWKELGKMANTTLSGRLYNNSLANIIYHNATSWYFANEEFTLNTPNTESYESLSSMICEIIRYVVQKPITAYEAVYFGHKQEMIEFLKEDVSIMNNIDGFLKTEFNDNLQEGTLLMHACEAENEDIAKYLLEKGADANAVNENGITALYLSVSCSSVTKLLIEKQVNLNIQTTYGHTSLIRASREDYYESCRLLLENGADTNLCTSKGYTALMLASYNDNRNIVELLLNYAVDVNAKDSSGDTALINCVLDSEKGYYETAKLLIEHGADIYAKNNDGESFVSLVEKHGFTKLQALAHSKSTELATIQGDNYEAFWGYYQMLQKDKSIHDYQKLYELYQGLLNNFDSIHRKRRKILYVDNQLPTKRPESFLPMLDSEKVELEDYLKFPIGHPVKGEFYVGHPHNPKTYFCLKDYEQALFMDKVMEINYIFQCLGANQITIDYAKGSNTELSRSFQAQQALQASVGKNVGKNKIQVVGVSNEFGIEANRNSNASSDSSLRTVQTFEPSKAPYIPENALWYHHDIHLQSVAKQRMEGNILEYTITISSKDVKVVSETEIQNIVAEVNTMLHSVSGSFKKTLESQQSNQETTEWIISVQFAPKSQLLESNQNSVAPLVEQANNTLSENEQKYLEDVKDMLEDDSMIDEAERKILERKREKFGITPERAKEIEKLANPLSEAEQDYLEDVEGFLQDDGEITPTARKALDRRAGRLGISPERVAELEALTIKKH